MKADEIAKNIDDGEKPITDTNDEEIGDNEIT
jgi:hypothetical protein